MAELYKMFSDLTRIQILWALESGELCVSDLASLLDMSSSAISHHLKTLRYANLVNSRREGKNIYYILADTHIKDILLQGFGHINE
ncbi:MAG TPA: transcriptional regulator [Clostridiales bacterium]|nr:transcriptional regulator [Clostridiales bacterium]